VLVERIDRLPEGWCGKNHAMQKAQRVTRGGKIGVVEASPEASQNRVDPRRAKEGPQRPGQLIRQLRMELPGRTADTIAV
jgi:hypothetical protein